jgi:hypothetical protein
MKIYRRTNIGVNDVVSQEMKEKISISVFARNDRSIVLRLFPATDHCEENSIG